MGYLFVVDKNDNVTGAEEFNKVKRDGLWHRSVNVLVFDNSDMERTLVSQIGGDHRTSYGKFHVSAGGHVRADKPVDGQPVTGQSYWTAAKEELAEEVFYNINNIPGFTMLEVGKIKKVSHGTDRQFSMIYKAFYEGPFSCNLREMQKLDFAETSDVLEAMHLQPKWFTQTFILAMHKALDMPITGKTKDYVGV